MIVRKVSYEDRCPICGRRIVTISWEHLETLMRIHMALHNVRYKKRW